MLLMMIFCFTGTLLKPEPQYKLEYQVTDNGWIIYEDKQYYFSEERVHMEQARRICQKNFADLVVIENESKRQFLWKYCYKIFGSKEEERLAWHSARSSCIELGGNLASIHDEQVQAFLTFYLKDVANETWIGLNDINHEHTYIWTDGSIFDYSKWARLFPSRDQYIEVDDKYITIQTDCIAMMKRSADEAAYWENTDCQHNKSYICQMDSSKFYFSRSLLEDIY
ncbi:macrophage mannose receptor 1-like [Limosa lapponica baueri]|uniref:Macrophage mannose receptor 1-like n=1 Tax=Limosa lapponica baueri TaxID=1758121 RepID=A0A2I0T4I6_LIMLA|nr:macrophage mannose receptor 1-like [Limosa lapponica baueri]